MTDKERLEHSKWYLLGFSLEVKKSKTIREAPRVEEKFFHVTVTARQNAEMP